LCMAVLIGRWLWTKRRGARHKASPRLRMHGSNESDGAKLREAVGSGSATPHRPKGPRTSLPQVTGRAGRARISGYLAHDDQDIGAGRGVGPGHGTGAEPARRNARDGERLLDGGKLMSTAI